MQALNTTWTTHSSPFSTMSIYAPWEKIISHKTENFLFLPYDFDRLKEYVKFLCQKCDTFLIHHPMEGVVWIATDSQGCPFDNCAGTAPENIFQHPKQSMPFFRTQGQLILHMYTHHPLLHLERLPRKLNSNQSMYLRLFSVPFFNFI